MLTIRFARVGKKNKAQYKIMLQEKSMAPGGRHVEILGSYDPHSKQALLKEERIKFWIAQGAGVSDTVHNLLVSQGVISVEKRAVKLPAKKVDKKDEEQKTSTDQTNSGDVKEEVKENIKEELKEEIKKPEVADKSEVVVAPKEKKIENKEVKDSKRD